MIRAPWQVIVRIVIAVLGILGNSLSIAVLCRIRKSTLRNAVTFLLNQSVVDLICSLSMAATSTSIITNDKYSGTGGLLRCIFWDSNGLVFILLVNSSYNLVAMTLERYISIVHPVYHRTRVTGSHFARILILISWLIGPIYLITLTFLTSKIDEEGHCRYLSVYPSPVHAKIAGASLLIMESVIPLSTLTFMYSLMGYCLYTKYNRLRNRESQIETPEKPNRQLHSYSKAKMNTFKTMFVIAVCFVLCWVTNQVFIARFIFGTGVSPTDLGFEIAALTVYLNASINPIIYCVQYQPFQAELKSWWRICGQKIKNCKKPPPAPAIGSDASLI